MTYLVTGGTGFIGRHLVRALLARGDATCQVLVRRGSEGRLDRLVRDCGPLAAGIHPVLGDVAAPNLGIGRDDLEALRGRVDHVFHLAAVYDMNVDARTATTVNVHGTRHTIEVARALGARCFHQVSSIGVAGRFAGRFLEHMLDEGQVLPHPYFESKLRAEQLVRALSDLPYRIYRPGIVVGDSRTGAMDQVNGPYYFFPLLRRLRDLVPRWLPLIGVDAGILPIVPVDFVAAAIDHLAHAPGHDGKTFHVVDANAHRLGEVVNILCRAAHGPEFALHLEARDLTALVPEVVRRLPAMQALSGAMLRELGIPPSVMAFADFPTTFDSRELDAGLAGSGIECPPLESYAQRLWDFWEEQLDPLPPRPLDGHASLAGRIVVVTGASSGIGRALAMQVAAHGGHALLVSHDAERLERVTHAIRARGGACAQYVADLRDLDACDRLVDHILREHGHIDVLVNNAGKSIRRSVELSANRFHDFQRTMQLNYFAAVRLIQGFLPGMRAQRSGHIVNVSTMGVQSGGPRFAGYLASKAALDAFSRSLVAEVLADGVRITTVHMPLVRTAMIEPTEIYRYAPALSADEAAAWVLKALVTRQRIVSTALGTAAAITYVLAPRLVDRIQSIVYRIVPESAAPTGERASGPGARLAPAALVSQVFRGAYV